VVRKVWCFLCSAWLGLWWAMARGSRCINRPGAHGRRRRGGDRGARRREAMPGKEWTRARLGPPRPALGAGIWVDRDW
jgi:hypothetical protein